MRRAILALAGAAAGTALLVGAKAPFAAGLSILHGSASEPVTVGGRNGGRNCASPSASPAGAPRSAAAGRIGQARVVAGPVATHRYGPVQVQVTVSNERIVDVIALQLPTGRIESHRINERVVPVLRSEALTAQSADIDTVSGATLTSTAYRTSLQGALDAAALGPPRC